jgi:hypothetical protein
MTDLYAENKDGHHHGECSDLSDHTLSMRQAGHYCEDLFDRLFGLTQIVDVIVGRHQDVLQSASSVRPTIANMLVSVHDRRLEANEQFWSQQSPVIPTVRIVTDQHGKIKQDQIWDFQDTYQKLNVPCLVLGLDRTHFGGVNDNWRRCPEQPPLRQRVGCESVHQNVVKKGRINRRWFLDTLGEKYLVPLRYHEDDDRSDQCGHVEQDHNVLDSEGRAVECKTCKRTIKEWIDTLEESEDRVFHDDHSRVDKRAERNSTIFYLKDWHLQQELQQFAGNDSKSESLYDCPDVFEHDMLNSFLKRFTNGDYRFCYWGPSFSSTSRHSDVLHSFSWSYNVLGTKEWTFYGPDIGINQTGDGDQQKGTSFSVRQETGQAIFVPATWQHTVINLEETISINHNWITMANLDLTWECLCTEMVDIQLELQRWSTSADDHDMEASENILRGCVGLDVTSFLLMTLVRLLELDVEGIEQAWTSSNECPESLNYSQTRQRRNIAEKSRLAAVLGTVLWQKQELVRLPRRLQAVLRSDSLATMVETMAIKLVEMFIGTTCDIEGKGS